MINNFHDSADHELDNFDLMEDNDNWEERPGSLSAIEQYLKGLSYPAEKHDLLVRANENNAPSDVLYILNLFENKKYESPGDISRELANIRE